MPSLTPIDTNRFFCLGTAGVRYATCSRVLDRGGPPFPRSVAEPVSPPTMIMESYYCI